ncbi:MAG: DUF4411 family protein [Saprospiraceae bacterium]
MPGYCLDTNVFIQAEKGPYGMDIMPGFWDWLDQQVEAGMIFSSVMVYEELTAGTDNIAEWSKSRQNSPLFQAPSPQAQFIFTDISDFVVANYSPAEADYFLSGADPWVIAQAIEAGAKVVTMEKLAGPGARKVKIPNICQEFGAGWIDTYSLLRELGARFTL